MTQNQCGFLDTLAERHQAAMVQLTYRRTGDQQLARDLVQETFLLACCKIEIVYQHQNPAAWLYNALNKLTMREMSRRYHTAEVPLTEELAGEDLPLSMEHYLPQGLSQRERELLLWRVEENLPFREIAERRGLTEAACRKQFSRLIRKCRQLLEEEPL